jgi:dolichol-phosphate mannosyltransferase
VDSTELESLNRDRYRSGLMPGTSRNGEQAINPAITVIVPVKNEAGNIAPLVAEITSALHGYAFEIVYVNDGSQDATEAELLDLMAQLPWLRQIRHKESYGKSSALRTGVTMAHAPIIVTLDGDGQNDPAVLPTLITKLEAGSPRLGLVAGRRVNREVTAFKKLQSRIANIVRSTLLKDGTSDSGCAIKAFRRDVFLSLPFFDGLDCFVPALVRREGLDIAYVDVVERPRLHGVSNYGAWNRMWVGLLDMAGVWWLIRRKKNNPQPKEITLAR